MRLLTNLLLLALCSLPLWLALPGYVNASWIGACWGAVFLAGVGVVSTGHRGWSVVHAGTIALVAQAALRDTTDLDGSASWLLIIALLSAGWLVGALLMPWRGTARSILINARTGTDVYRAGQPRHDSVAGHRVTLWDLFCATTLVGLGCWIAPHVNLGLDVLCQVAPALFGGMILSTLAFQWAQRDDWSIAFIIALPITLLAALLVVVPWSATTKEPHSMLLWVIAGPMSVIAAQFVIVLAGLASWRGTTAEV